MSALSLLVTLASPGLRAGDRAPPLEAMTLDGRLARVPLTGRVTIVDFFATWCPRCRESVSSYQELTRQFGDRLQIVVVDVEEPAARVAGFFAANPLPGGTILLTDPDGQTVRRFGPKAFPSFYVIDESGTVRSVMRGWGSGSAAKLGEWVGFLLRQNDQRTPAAAGRRRKPRPAPPAGISADEHARRIGVEVLR